MPLYQKRIIAQYTQIAHCHHSHYIMKSYWSKLCKRGIILLLFSQGKKELVLEIRKKTGFFNRFCLNVAAPWMHPHCQQNFKEEHAKVERYSIFINQKVFFLVKTVCQVQIWQWQEHYTNMDWFWLIDWLIFVLTIQGNLQ